MKCQGMNVEDHEESKAGVYSSDDVPEMRENGAKKKKNVGSAQPFLAI